jgi:exosortase A
MATVPAARVNPEHRPVLVGATVAGALLAVSALYWDTFASLVAIWERSDTFAHCFLVAPISAWLIWLRRKELAAAPLSVSVWGVGAVVVLAFGWVVASIASIQVGQQLCAVLLVPAVVVALAGVRAARTIAFPLAYLVFAVPFGEALVPTLMDFTADFTVAALRLTGIPVLRDGLYFSIPAGDFEVAEACSGLRYLIACVVLGLLYGYLAYSSWRKRAVFFLVCVVAPIVANGIRAYMIVLIAHVSEMRYATGIDHLVYGWLFFAFLIAALFWMGGRFRDPPEGSAVTLPPVLSSTNAASFVVAGALLVLLAATGPYSLRAMQADDLAPTALAIRLPTLVEHWVGPRESPGPGVLGNGAEGPRGQYVGPRGTVELELITARHARDSDIVGHVPRSIGANNLPATETMRLDAGLAGASLRVSEVVFMSRPGAVQLLWYWYRVGEVRTAEDWRAKALEAWSALAREGRSQGTLFVVSTEQEDRDRGRQALREFLDGALAAIERCASAGTDEC